MARAAVQVILGMTFAGSGVPFAWAAMAKLVVDAVRPSETGIASGVNTVVRLIGAAVRTELAATVLANRTIRGSSLPAASGYSLALWIAVAIALCGVLTALALTPRGRKRLTIAVETD